MHLTERQQTSFENIESIQAASSDVEWYELPTPQPFTVPYNCVERYQPVPNYCKARLVFKQLDLPGITIKMFQNYIRKTIFLLTGFTALDK